MTDRKDPPIEEVEFVSGVTVLDFGDIRVARGLSRRPFSTCKHRRLRYDTRERRIWCADCERDLEGFDAFVVMTEQAHAFAASINERAEQVAEAEQFSLRSRAAKAVDEVWRSKNMVPCCHHCNRGLLPEHFADGVKKKIGKDFARQQEKAFQK